MRKNSVKRNRNMRRMVKRMAITGLLACLVGLMTGCSATYEVTTSTEEFVLTPDAPRPDVEPDVEPDVQPDVKLTAVNLTEDVDAAVAEQIALDEAFLLGTSQFSVTMLQQCLAAMESDTQNVMVSPTSLQLALAIAANGADGDTLKEMESVLMAGKCGDGMDISKLTKYLTTFVKQLSDAEGVEFHSANSFWVRDDKDRIQVKKEFLQNIKSFDAEAYQAPFDDTTVADINGWVNQHTNQMIPELLKEIPADAVAYIINALAFEAEWSLPYEDYQINERIFTNAAGVEQTMRALSSEEKHYLEDDSAIGFMKSYKGGKYAFAALLPKEGSAVDYVNSLTGEQLQSIFKNRSYEDVNVVMPCFKSEYSVSLNDALRSMGMPSAFSPNTADFSKMADTETGLLYINQVLQKTFIEVDEHGTKAAAATMIGMTDCAAAMEEPKYVILDRPFVYAIVDTETNLPVFFGVLNSVE